MVAFKYLDKEQKELRVEQYSSKAKALSVIELFEKDEVYRAMIPKECEYISISDSGDNTSFWLDRRENTIFFRAWSLG